MAQNSVTNTAPVLEFLCLYTTDLRRKQKRWQDGRLKFHTFNKRVMVYDERANFVGDSHWREDGEFENGLELELERGGVLVEVGECVGKKEQDLTELVDKRVKDRVERVAAKNAESEGHHQALPKTPQTPAGTALRNKSLNAVLGNPTGCYGKAVISNLSPFEQRQQLEERQSNRPAKRRMQETSPPSKSGYAQNLMGTKLNLQSSKPPSTATIRYEPLRATIQRTQPTTIDLTADEDVHMKLGTPRKGKSNEDTQPGNSRRHRTDKPPPARSGYASSLTGASLALTRPEAFSSKLPSKGLLLNIRDLSQANGTGNMDSSSPVDEDSRMDEEEESVKEIVARAAKEPLKKKAKPSTSFPANTSRSSPPPISRATKLSKASVTVKQKVIQNPPLARLMEDQPVSTLRIKARPPRKMMMLMERPLSRFPIPMEMSDTIQIAPKRLKKSRTSPQEVVLCEESMRLDSSFREKQERIFEARLNSKQTDNCSEELSSLPIDSGINHVLIDNLLSRKTIGLENVNSAIAVRASKVFGQESAKQGIGIEHGQPSLVQMPSRTVNGMILSETVDALAITVSTKASSPTQLNSAESVALELHAPRSPGVSEAYAQAAIDSHHTGRNRINASHTLIDDTGTKRRVGKPGFDTSILETPGLPDAELKETMASRISNELERAISTDKRELSPKEMLPKFGSSVKTSNPLSPQPLSRSILTTAESPTHTMDPEDGIIASPLSEMGITVPSFFPQAGLKTLALPINGAITSATDHFLAMLKSSKIPSGQVALDAPPPEAKLKQHELSSAQALRLPELENRSSDVAIKASPQSSPAVTGILGCDGQVEETVDFTTVTNNSSRTKNPLVPAIPNAITGLPKTGLVNPATRGLSVQLTANRTLDAIIPAINWMPGMPPPPRISRREAVEEVGGPWSRESFDLFGSWRPPGRGTGTNAVTG